MIRLLNTPKVEVRTYLGDESETSLSPKGNICSLCQYPESDQLCYCNREDETLSPVMVIETIDSPSREFRNKEPSQNDEQEGSLKSELKYDFCAEGEEM